MQLPIFATQSSELLKGRPSRQTVLRGCASVLAVAGALTAASQAVAQPVPDGFENDTQIVEPGDGVVISERTLTEPFLNGPNGQIIGLSGTGVEITDGSELQAGFNNQGLIQGGTSGLIFRAGTSLQGGFTNTGTIIAGGTEIPEEVVPSGGTVTVLQGGLVNLGPGAFTPVASVITFSEFSLGTVNPTYTFTGLPDIGDVTVTFEGHFAGQSTVGSFVVTLDDTTPNGPLTLDPNAPDTFIVGDGSNPTSPVLSGIPTFNGPISVLFSSNVAAVGLDAGFFNAVGGTSIEAFDRDGNSLGIITNSLLGIEFYGLATADGASRIAGISFYVTGDEPAGFAIDNLTFGGPRSVNIATPGRAFYSGIENWVGPFSNGVNGLISGFSAGAVFEGFSFTGLWDNAGRLEGGLGETGSGPQIGVSFDYDTFSGDIVNRAGASIVGGITGGLVRVRNFIGTMRNDGLVQGFGQNTGWHVISELFEGDIIVGSTGVYTAGSRALHLEINRMTGVINNQGLIEATDPDGIAVLIQGLFVEEEDPVIGDSIAIAADALPEGIYEGGLINSGRIKAGPLGTAIKIEASLLQPVRNSGQIEGLIAIDNTLAPTALSFIQTGGATKGDILFGGAAGSARFEGGSFWGALEGDGNDRVEISGGASPVSLIGEAGGLASLKGLAGQAVLGASAPDAAGPGFFGSGLGTIQFNAQTFLSSNTSLFGDTLGLGDASVLSYFLTGDNAVAPTIGVSGDAALDGVFRVFLDPSALAVLAQGPLIVENVFTAGAFTGAFDALAYAGTNQILRMSLLIEDAAVVPSVAGAGDLSAFAAGDAIITASSTATLIITPFEFSSTPDPTGFGEILDLIYESGDYTADLGDVLLFIGLGDLDEVAERIRQLKGTDQAETPTVFYNTNNNFNDDTNDRTNALRNQAAGGGGCTTTVSFSRWGCFERYAQAADKPLAQDTMTDADPFAWLESGLRDPGRTAVWGRAFGIWGERHESIFADASDQQTAGFIAGVDHTFDKRFMAGLSVQLSDSQVDYARSPNEADIRAYQVGGYFSYGDPDLYVSGVLSGIFSEYDTYRRILIGPFLFEPRANYDSDAISAQVEIARLMEVGGLLFQPLLTLSYNEQWIDRYQETGAGGLGLIVADDNSQSLRTILGARLGIPLELGSVKIVPVLGASWSHEFLDTRQSVQAAFIGAPNVPFTILGTPVGRDTAHLTAGFSMPLGKDTTLYADYTAAINEAFQTHTASAGIRVSW